VRQDAISLFVVVCGRLMFLRPSSSAGGSKGEQAMYSRRLSFGRRDIPAAIVATALTAFSLYVYFRHPDWQRATGFGPEWQCTQPGRAGSDFCIKKSVLESKNQAKTPN
jgi:hypothetical protein